MSKKLWMPILAIGTLTTLGACDRRGPSENRTDVATADRGAKTETKTETTQVGSTLESKTVVRSDAGRGTIKGTTETYIGTVTAYTAGKNIEVMTGEKKTHSFDLAARDTTSTIDPKVTVGSKVRLVEETGDNKARQIMVRIEGSGI